jgi:hypothetical protein
METPSGAPENRFIGSLLDEGMSETERVGPVRHLDQDPGAKQL